MDGWIPDNSPYINTALHYFLSFFNCIYLLHISAIISILVLKVKEGSKVLSSFPVQVCHM